MIHSLTCALVEKSASCRTLKRYLQSGEGLARVRRMLSRAVFIVQRSHPAKRRCTVLPDGMEVVGLGRDGDRVD